MSNSDNASQSILPAVAKHERELLARVRATEEEAQRIIETARSDARAHSQACEAKLAEEIARIRRASEDVRLSEFQATVDAAEDRLVSVREGAMQRVAEMANTVQALFTPNSSGGSQT